MMDAEQENPDKSEDAYLVDHVGADLWLAFRAYEKAMFERVAAQGFPDITVPDSDVLVFIGPGGAQVVEIARQRRVSKQAVHEQVHSLVKRGYLTLEPDPDDRRARIVRHSKKGRELVGALKQIKIDLHGQIEAAFGPCQLGELRRLLGQIQDQLQQRPKNS